ncbi:MAG: hypothetical protein NTZ90_13435 [Proteobacteria bacterium]|nr:hypothetical protein [Pseudomonadota bacterium]
MMIVSHVVDNFRLKLLLRRLESAGFEAGQLELVSHEGLQFANLFMKSHEGVISPSVFCGASASAPIAVAKALVECIETEAFLSGRSAGFASCQTEKSEGFAGYPTTLITRRTAVRLCRAKALAEAIERFAWATWWDDESVSYQCRDLGATIPEERRAIMLLNGIPSHSPLKSLRVIEPTTSATGFALRIMLAEFADGGFITGGAAGPVDPRGLASITQRAASELARHVLALDRMAKARAEPTTPYEAKLSYFGFGQGSKLVRMRLAVNGAKVVELPDLVVDEEILHKFSKQVVVYRCLFKNQPPFVSGPIGRLCI